MRYDPNHVGLSGYLRESPELKVEMLRRARTGLAVGQALAPRLSRPRRDRVPGALAASGHVVDDGIGGARHDRMQVSVIFDVFYAVNVSFDQRRAREITRAYLEAMKAVIEAGG